MARKLPCAAFHGQSEFLLEAGKFSGDGIWIKVVGDRESGELLIQRLKDDKSLADKNQRKDDDNGIGDTSA